MFISSKLLAFAYVNTDRHDTHLGKKDAVKCFPSLATSKGARDLSTQDDTIGKSNPGLQLYSHPKMFPTINFKGAVGLASSQSGDDTRQLNAACYSGTLDSGKVDGGIHPPEASSRGNLSHGCFPCHPLGGGVAYVKRIFDIYRQVVLAALPDFLGSWVPVPCNLHISEWISVATTATQLQVMDIPTFGFPSGFECIIPSTSFINHQSASDHPCHVASYIWTELWHGAMLGPFDHPPCVTWCQTSPLLTWPKNGSSTRHVIFDLSWPQPPAASVNGGTQTYLPRSSYM